MRRLIIVAALAVAGFAALPAGPAAAHPLGNFSVNRSATLTVHPDRIDALAVADLAELPTIQDAPASCDEAAAALSVTVGGEGLRWAIRDTSLTYAAGAGGLKTSRLECRLFAPAEVTDQTRVDVAYSYRDDRIGWRELVATGSGVRLEDSPLPARSPTNELRSYPSDPLASPADVRSASFTAAPAPGAAPAAQTAGTSIDRPSGLLAGFEQKLDNLVGGTRLTPLVGLLAVLLSLLLGAAHAALPGHGKTVMAAYLAGSQGRPRDAVLVGATVTFTHTAGVIALGLFLTAVSGVAGEAALGWLGLTSGLLVATVGIGALVSSLRRRTPTGSAPLHHTHDANPTHDHAHAVPPAHDHAHAEPPVRAHGPGGDPDQAHDYGHGHDHGHGHHHGPGKWGLAGLGVAGGLVPSPSALVVLLGAAALGRTVFGVLLVFAYGLGMAATLTAAGLLLVRLRHRIDRRRRFAARWRTVAPSATAALIIVVGVGLAGRALASVS